MSFAGAANAASAAQTVVSEDAIQSVRDGILGNLRPQQVLDALVAPPKETPKKVEPDPEQAAADACRMRVLFHHDEQVRQRERKERIRLMLIGVGAFAIGYFATREAMRNESRNRSAAPQPSRSTGPERSALKRKVGKREPITIRVE